MALTKVTGRIIDFESQTSIPGNVVVAGNVEANYFVGDGSNLTGVSSVVTTVANTAPSSANPGDVWISGVTGITYTYIQDEDSSQWVQISQSLVGGGSSGLSAVTLGGVSGSSFSNVQVLDATVNTGYFDTANISENGNLYYTNARVYSNVSSLGYASTGKSIAMSIVFG